MSGIAMPEPNAKVLARRSAIAADLRAHRSGRRRGGRSGRRCRPSRRDGLTAYRQMPMLVVLPETVEQVSQILRYCHEHGIRVVPRGSGTSLSGGALPLADGVLLVMSKFNKVLDVDFENRAVVVQPGVTNLGVTNAVVHRGFYYAPDPSSQIACSIGGNVAENSGGVHCLKYGLTANNVLGIEMVLITGEVIRLGGKHLDAEGYDLLGLMTGSEGLLGVVTEVTVRHPPVAGDGARRAVGFPSSEDGGRCVADIIGAGIIPGGMEMMDKPAIHAAEDFVHAGYPRDVEALLIVELDGPQREVSHLLDARRGDRQGEHARALRVSNNEAERLAFWAGRKAAFPAVGRISPDYYCMDGTIPRKELPRVLAPHPRAVAALRPARRQRFSRRRRQPASAHPLRRQQAGRDRARGGVRRGHSEAMRAGRRRADRRARRRRREARPDAGDVQQGRPRAAGAGEVRLRPKAPAQSRKDVSRAAPLRRARPHARASRARCPFPTCRGSDRDSNDDVCRPDRRRGRARSRALGGGRGAAARSLRPWLEARRRPAGAGGAWTRSFRAFRRHALRAGGAGAFRQAPARRWRRSKRCSTATTRCSPSSRWISGRSSARRAGAARSAARSRQMPAARAASRPARRATMCSASTPSPAAARHSSRAGAW